MALRYLRGKGKATANAVPILSRISIAAIAVGCGALLVLFSVFNGFNAVIDQFYTAFYSDLRIRPAVGKTFELTPEQRAKLAGIKGIQAWSPVLEDRVLAAGEGAGTVVSVRGVAPEYFKVARLSDYIQMGIDTVSVGDGQGTALLGIGVAGRLGISPENAFSYLNLHYPNPEASASSVMTAPTDAFQSLRLRPDGIFAVESEFDDHYVIAPLSMVQELLGAGNKISSIEVSLAPKALKSVTAELKTIFGPTLKYENRQQQNATFYGIMAAEKWAVYFILLLVLLIASFNLVGALSMLILEKQKDIAILRAMGATRGTIRSIFLSESLLWSTIGGIIGIALGALLCAGQQRFEWIKLEGAFLINAYPVALQWGDVGVVLLTAIGLGLVAGILPAWRATKEELGILR